MTTTREMPKLLKVIASALKRSNLHEVDERRLVDLEEIKVINQFQNSAMAAWMTAIGSLMILYIGGYQDGPLMLIVRIMAIFVPASVPFETAWLAFWLAIYILTCISIFLIMAFIDMGRIDLQEEIYDQINAIHDRLDDLEHSNDLLGHADLLTESMANLADKIDEIKLHL